MTKLEQLMSKEMTRRQFLMTVGLGFASLFGLSAILGAFSEADNSDSGTGYGSGRYSR